MKDIQQTDGSEFHEHLQKKQGKQARQRGQGIAK